VSKLKGQNQTGTWVLIHLLMVLSFLTGKYTYTQAKQKSLRNPFTGQPAAINEGKSIFRTQCALCHGIEARGGLKGPNLTSARWTHGDSDDTIFRTITEGVPGTQMPANNFPPEKTWKLIAYLRSLSARASVPALGNRAAGEEIFLREAHCSQCHMVNGHGGRLGPDLSRIGASRSIPYLKDKIREPSKLGEDMTVGLWWELGLPLVYQTVTLVTKDDRRITGALRNEDTFSIQLMDQGEELLTFWKKDLQQVIHERSSLMPRYDEQRLSEKELQDLLAYLDSLRGP